VWLQEFGVEHVAMESTGVYWKPVWNVLERHFQIVLANAQHIKAVPGCKPDTKDCQWIAELLQHGLLRGSFIPISCVVLAIELIYSRAPEVRRPLRSTLLGAVVGLVTWLALSSGLGIFLRNFARLNKTYGALAAAIALMLWLHWAAVAILLGAEFNLEMERLNNPRRPSPEEETLQPGTILRSL
jgi:YihY family inner membrane protein